MKNKLFILIVLTGLLLRILTLNVPLYDDAGSMPSIAKYHDKLLGNIVLYPHGITNTLFFFMGMKLFGVSTLGIRLTLFVFSLTYLCALYFFVKKILSKETAQLTVILNLFTFFAYFNYFIVESDGIIQTFFALFTLFPAYIYLREKKILWLLISLMSFSFVVSMKHRTGLIIISLFIISIYLTKSFKKTVLFTLIHLLSATTFTAFSFYLVYLVNNTFAHSLFSIIFSHNTTQTALLFKLTHPQLFSTLIIALTPLLLFLPLLSLCNRKKEYVLLYSWLVIPCAYIFLIPPGLSIVKYVAALSLTPLTILAADVINNFSIKQRLATSTFAGTLLLSFVFILINNTLPKDYWFFLTEMGPVIKVWQPIIIFVFLISLICFLLIIINYAKTIAIIIFLVSTLSFNILMLTDNIIDDTHSKMIAEMENYAVNNAPLGRIYAWNEDIPFYLGDIGFYIVPENEDNFGLEYDMTPELRKYSRLLGMGEQGFIDLAIPLEVIKKYFYAQGGTVFLLNYPYKYVIAKAPLDLKKKLQFIDEYCEKKQETNYSTAQLLIYACTPQHDKNKP